MWAQEYCGFRAPEIFLRRTLQHAMDLGALSQWEDSEPEGAETLEELRKVTPSREATAPQGHRGISGEWFWSSQLEVTRDL